MADTIPSLFLERVKQYGPKVALREKDFGIWHEISWDKYYENVEDFALGLVSLGFEKGDCLSVLSENRQEWLYSDIAAQCLGGLRTGIYPTNPAFEVHYQLKHSKATVCVVEDQEQTDKVLEVKDDLPDLKNIIYVDPKGMRKYSDPMLMCFADVQELGRKEKEKKNGFLEQKIKQIRDDEVAIMVYTSGTTGPPKGAMLDHGSLLIACRHFCDEIKFRDSDNIVSYLPLCHAAESMFSLFIPMLTGTITNFAESINTVQDALNEIAPDFYFGVPRIWEKMHSQIYIKMQDSIALKRLFFNMGLKIGERIAQKTWNNEQIGPGWKLLNSFANLICFRPIKDKLGLLNARIVLSATAPISPEILKFFHTLGLFIQEGYGMTENCGFTFMQRQGEFLVGSVGTALPGVEYKIVEDGELLVKSRQNFAGYFRDSKATADTIDPDGWLHTGDVVKEDKNGNLYVIDRKKDIIITAGGKNISPSEIEHRLKTSPYIREVVVIGDKRKFVSALIEIDYDNVGKWAINQRLPYTSYKDLAAKPEVVELIEGEVRTSNKYFARVENIRKFKIVPKELDVDDGDVTATQKIKRKNIMAAFSELVESIYT